MLSGSSQVGGLEGAEAKGSSGMELKSSVSVHSFEVRNRRRGNVSSQTHTDTPHHIHRLYGIPPTQPPPDTLTLYPSASCLPVSNSDQSVGFQEDSSDRKGKNRRRRTYQRSNQWVCQPHQTVAFNTIGLHATALLWDFSGYLHRLSPVGCYVTTICLIDCVLIFIHLTAGS